MTNPCKDCEDRCLGCHSDCKKYIEFFRFNRQKNKRQIAEARQNAYVVEAIQKCKEGRSGSWKTYRHTEKSPSD